MPIPDSHADLLGAPHFGHLATLNADGSPTTSPVWITRDGDDVLLTSAEEFRKIKNLRRDPRAALSVHDQNNPYRYIEVRGRAEITPVDGTAFLDSLARAYWDVERYPNPVPRRRVIVRLRVDHAVAHG